MRIKCFAACFNIQSPVFPTYYWLSIKLLFGCRAGRYEVDGYVYNANEEPKILMTGKWNESMSYQPCDMEGEPLPGTELKEVNVWPAFLIEWNFVLSYANVNLISCKNKYSYALMDYRSSCMMAS